ncbi:MAG: hypothetical protein WBB00_07405 [Mycobacterium sp.]
MKVTVEENSADRLRLRLQNSPVPYIGWGSVFIAAGCWAIWLLGATVAFAADRDGVEYTRTFMGLRVTEQLTASAAEVTAIDIVLDDGLIWRSYELAVHTDSATAVIGLPSADGSEKEELARQAWAAVSGTGAPVTYADRAGLITASVLGGACIAGGVVCILAYQRGRVVADRATQTITVTRKRALGRRSTVGAIPITSQTKVTVKASTTTTPRHTVTSYRVLVSAHGNSVSLTRGPTFTESSAQLTARLLTTWLAEHTI